MNILLIINRLIKSRYTKNVDDFCIITAPFSSLIHYFSLEICLFIEILGFFNIFALNIHPRL